MKEHTRTHTHIRNIREIRRRLRKNTTTKEKERQWIACTRNRFFSVLLCFILTLSAMISMNDFSAFFSLTSPNFPRPSKFWNLSINYSICNPASVDVPKSGWEPFLLVFYVKPIDMPIIYSRSLFTVCTALRYNS